MSVKINKDIFNIWRYSEYYPTVKLSNRLSLEEGWTKEIHFRDLEQEFHISSLFLKRDDLNPNGAHKDRGLAYQVSKAKEDGQREVVLPSSGNCAISAAAYCNLANIKLTAFVPKNISSPKLVQLNRFTPHIVLSEHAIEDAKDYSVSHKVRNLSPEIEEFACYGFKSIAFEIYEKLGKIDSIFLPVSSGASLVGIGKAHQELTRLKLIEKLPELHAVQTEAVAPISSEFQKHKTKKKSIAEGIMAKTTARKEEAVCLIRESHGSGWVVSDREILIGLRILRRKGIDTSPEGGAAFIAILKAAQNRNLGKVVCLLTGHGLKSLFPGDRSSRGGK